LKFFNKRHKLSAARCGPARLESWCDRAFRLLRIESNARREKREGDDDLFGVGEGNEGVAASPDFDRDLPSGMPSSVVVKHTRFIGWWQREARE
jgi:hypothetical protein